MAITAPQPAPAAPAGQPATPAPGTAPAAQPGAPQAASGEGAQTQAVTKADLEEFGRTIEARIQSLTGKAENRINKKIADLQKAGVTVTPQQAEALIAQEDQTAHPAAAPAPAPAQAPGQPAPQLDPVKALALQYMAEEGLKEPNPYEATAYLIMAKANTKLVDADPESIKIKEDAKVGIIKDEDDFLAAVKEAVKAKKARLERIGSPARATTVAGAGTPSSTPAHAGLSGSQTLDMAFEKLLK